jgi:hypothetical protein
MTNNDGRNDRIVPKSSMIFLCEKCDYNTSRNSQYIRHLSSAKHCRMTDDDANSSKCSAKHICGCGKQYKYRQGLFTHRKVCNYDTYSETLPALENTICEPVKLLNIDTRIPQVQCPPQTVDMSVVLELLKQNNDFKQLVIEQTKQLFEQQQHNNQLLEAVKDGKLGNNNCNNTTNSHNKFNLNVFLNETCKDAISMDDFINSLEVTRDDFIRTGNVGFVEGMSTVLVKRIRNMELHTRPMHCTDLKRETVYIKHDDKWEKEDTDKTHLRKAVKVAAHKNMNEMKKWYHDSKPAVDTNGTAEYEDYFKYYKSALGGFDKEEDKEFEEKIIKNVLKEVQVDKTSIIV